MARIQRRQGLLLMGVYVSLHVVPVVSVHLEKHPNADALSIVKVKGFTVVTRTDGWTEGQLAAYLPPDSVVDTRRPEFAFLEDKDRIKVRKFRGVYSEGLLVPAPAGAKVGDDVAEQMGVTHYEPTIKHSKGGGVTGGDTAPAPEGFRPGYDIENIKHYPDIFLPNEQVVMTEKIHGACARFAFVGGEYHAGSRREWKREYGRKRVPSFWASVAKRFTGHYPEWGWKWLEDAGRKNTWWQALDNTEGLWELLLDNDCLTAYGEIYGPVQHLTYGTPNQVKFALFDLWNTTEQRWLNWEKLEKFASDYGVPAVPKLYSGPFNLDLARKLAEENSSIPGADHEREGVVIRPLIERQDHSVGGRVQLKLIGNRYLERS